MLWYQVCWCQVWKSKRCILVSNHPPPLLLAIWVMFLEYPLIFIPGLVSLIALLGYSGKLPLQALPFSWHSKNHYDSPWVPLMGEGQERIQAGTGTVHYLSLAVCVCPVTMNDMEEGLIKHSWVAIYLPDLLWQLTSIHNCTTCNICCATNWLWLIHLFLQ